jgi:phenylacetate-CoA ligase
MNVSKENSSSSIISLIRQKKSDFWTALQKKTQLALFYRVAKEVPAYKDFLRKHHISLKKIKKHEDFKTLPHVTKTNYLTKYSIENLSWEGNLKKPLIFTSTSGSTGDPFYFHRSFSLDWQASVLHELFYLNGHYKKDEPVLVIVCFGMGVWIGGLITYQAFHMLQEREYNISIITPGINKQEIFKSIKNLGQAYKNIILVGYPPFIKDVLDEAPLQGITWKDFRIRLLFAAEAFTENFREYVSKKVNIKNQLLDTMNIYGSADFGAMAFETPLSILIRKLCVKNPALFELIFKKIHKTPTLCQYIPSFISFDADGEDLLISGNSTMPFVKYSLGDHGGVYTFSGIEKKFAQFGINLNEEIKKAGLEKTYCQLPFVYVYERSDFSTTLYGLQIYPETIKDVLLQQPFSSYVTGKITLETIFDKKQNQRLIVHVEIKKEANGIVPRSIEKAIIKAMVEQLTVKNAEYKELHRFIGRRALPQLQFWPSEDPMHFKVGIKQKWVKK